MLSIVIPALNEAEHIEHTLRPLQALRTWGHEVIVVDGGSQDDTEALARPLVDQIIRAPCGRARQMNAGAAVARGDALVFLHADTRLPKKADRMIAKALRRTARVWGRFDVRLSGRGPVLRLVERLMNLRSRLSGIATGDQAIFVRRAVFERVGGFPDIPLMEDIVLSKTLRQLGRPACIRRKVQTSSRRWERQGVGRTIVEMWWLRLRFFLGADPTRLARIYERHTRTRAGSVS